MATPNKYTSKLQGARILIIGGSSGVGYGVAEALLAHDASVVISSSSPDRVAKAIQRLQVTYPTIARDKIQGFPCNLGEPATLDTEVSTLFENISKAFKGQKLDHVVFTAGDKLDLRPIENFDVKSIQQAGVVRFTAPLIVAKHLRQYLKGGPASSYTITTGAGSEHLIKEWAVMQSYLYSIRGMARALAVDLAPIRVNAIALGAVDTEMWDAAKQTGRWEALADIVSKKTTLGSIGKVEDVAECYLYVMKDYNVAGATIESHGGTLLM